jgi:hypothetical protein
MGQSPLSLLCKAKTSEEIIHSLKVKTKDGKCIAFSRRRKSNAKPFLEKQMVKVETIIFLVYFTLLSPP